MERCGVNSHAEISANKVRTPVYLDYQATTPTDPRVVEYMMPYFFEKFGNPHSRSHQYGWSAEEAVNVARGQLAALIGAAPKDVIFTSGATEANNLAIKGAMRFYRDKGRHMITLVTEHKCVLEACRSLEADGYSITYLPVKSNGILDTDILRAAITDETVLVSVSAVNNEIGVVQPIAEIGKICKEKGVFFHSDGAQALGKIDVDVEAMNIDLLSMSSHKVYGPQGIGGLYIRRKNPRVRLSPLISGGGQERGLRSGTVPLPLAVGFGKAAEIAMHDMHRDNERIKGFYNMFIDSILDSVPHVFLNGDRVHRVPHNVNLSFVAIEGESMIMSISDLAVSSGSACTSSSLEPSHVLRGLGVGEDLAHSSIRFSFGRFTTREEVEFAIRVVEGSVDRLRSMSPLWDMVQEGIDLGSVDWGLVTNEVEM